MRQHLLVVLLWLASGFVPVKACPVPIQTTPNDTAKALRVSKLNSLMKCDPADPGNDQSPCNTFAGKGIELIYGYSDFKSATGYLDAKHIHTFVANSKRWVHIGSISDASNNACAQSLANTGRAVVAVEANSTNAHGHIALILPGTLVRSGKWNMPVANSASFFIGQPLRGYVNDLLSKAFSPINAAQAEFYYRKLDEQP